MAEGSEDPFPEGLLAHAELQLRRAYEHSAVERGREVADRVAGGGAASGASSLSRPRFPRTFSRP